MDYEFKQEYIKTVMLGESKVGKTSLAMRYVKNSFNSQQKSTINAYYQEKSVQIENYAKDTAGQEEFNAMMPMYYRGAILVYDIAYCDTFERVHKWIKELKSFADPDIVIAIVGNKSDLENIRQVSFEKAEKYARHVGAMHFQGSAKSGAGVQEIFKGVIKAICEKREGKNGGKKDKKRVNLKMKQEENDGYKCCD